MAEQLQHIIQGCQKKDRKMQHELYKLFYSYGMSICIRYVQNENDAIAILNEAFLKVFNNINKYNFDFDFKPWLRKIIVNTAIDEMKKKKRLMINAELEEAKSISERENIISKIGYKELMALVHTLSDAYRTVFNMYVIDGYKHEEIATQLEISVGTSKSNLSKARAILRKKLSKQLNLHHG